MNNVKALLVRRSAGWILAAAVQFLAGISASAEVQHLSITQPGGFPGAPVLTGIERTTNGARVTWDGPSGFYQLFQKTSLTGQSWQKVGSPTATRSATVTDIHSNAFFRVQGPSPHYAGAQVCADCHADTHTSEMDTRHAGAFTDPLFVAAGGQTNNSCLPCHTVGYGLPTGFISIGDFRSTNQLAGVQCESCHGPAANHAANDTDPSVRPRVEIAATVCGGCHTGAQQPTYDEWNLSRHARVTEPDMNPNSCGQCHITPARVAMLKGQAVPQDDTNVGVVCAACHDPHRRNVHANALNGVFMNTVGGVTVVITNNLLGPVYTNQVRNPLASLVDYHASGDLATYYNADVNVCAQCHNDRAASTNSVSRPPHHSPQYNILLGTVGEIETGVRPNARATHALLEKQCTGCHMQTAEHQNGPPEVAAVTGHRFQVTTYEVCARCHGTAEFAQTLKDLILTPAITNKVNEIKNDLDDWGLTKSPEPLRSKYGKLAWEYTTPGDLSTGGPGPDSNEQKLIPANIIKARFNLYLVVNDGSVGVHNPHHCQNLLNLASGWVKDALKN